MDRIEEWLSGPALARYQGVVAIKGRPLVVAIAADLARIGLDPHRITDALVERCVVLGIRLRGDYPSRAALHAIAESASKEAKVAALLDADQRQTEEQTRYSDRQRAIADHTRRQEMAASARAVGQDPRNIESERLAAQERRAAAGRTGSTGGAQSLDRNEPF